MNTTTLITKEEFQNAINYEVQRRTEALQEITRLTLAVFDQNVIIQYANTALNAYQNIRQLKKEMRELHPPTCTCTCDNHNQEF